MPMQIIRIPGETEEAFRARAFRINRDYQYFLNRSTCECNQGRIACDCLIGPKQQARPMTRDELRALGTPLAFGPTYRMTRVRAIWYCLGLAFGVSLVAMAVFWMGN